MSILPLLFAPATCFIFPNIRNSIYKVLSIRSIKQNHHKHQKDDNHHDHLLPIHPLHLYPQQTNRKMCNYTYTLFTCGHGTHIWAEDIELCPTHRLLSAHGPSPFDGLECPSSVGTCEGVNDWLCDECTEVWDLEAGCEREL